MKTNNILKISLLGLMSLISVVGCGEVSNAPLITPPPSIPFSSIDMDNHTHVFDQEVAIARYRCEGTTCGSAATYYKSCICGEKGTETFTLGDAAAHTYELVIEGEYKTKYLIGEKISTENMSAKLVCTKQDDEQIVEVKDLLVSQEALKREDKSMVIACDYNGKRYEKQIPISVDSFRLNSVNLDVRNDRIYYQILGDYGNGYKEIVERARFSLTVWKDYFEIGKVNPVCTPSGVNASYGSWMAEIDVTDISPTTEIAQGKSKNLYWPHFFIEDESGVVQNKDLSFPELENISKKIKETDKDTYQLFKYHETAKQIYIPTLGKLCEETLPEVQYFNSKTTDELPAVGESYTIGSKTFTAIETMYMVHDADLLNVEDAIVIRLYGKLRGFNSSDEFMRSTKLYLRDYWKNPSTYSKVFSSYDGNQVYYFGKYNVDIENGTFTMDVNISKMGFDFASATGSTDGDGANTSRSGVRYFRMHTDESGGYSDITFMSTKNHNKSLTLDGKKYTLYCDKDASGYLGVWGCLGFGVDKA